MLSLLIVKNALNELNKKGNLIMYAKTIIVGRLGQDPVLKFVGADATPVCKFSVAAGIGEKDIVWHDAVFWGKR